MSESGNTREPAAPTGAVDVDSGGEPELKRVMGHGLLLLFIVGDILGTGVYALTGDVARIRPRTSRR